MLQKLLLLRLYVICSLHSTLAGFPCASHLHSATISSSPSEAEQKSCTALGGRLIDWLWLNALSGFWQQSHVKDLIYRPGQYSQAEIRRLTAVSDTLLFGVSSFRARVVNAASKYRQQAQLTIARLLSRAFTGATAIFSCLKLYCNFPARDTTKHT
jgi:hypothetical protein